MFIFTRAPKTAATQILMHAREIENCQVNSHDAISNYSRGYSLLCETMHALSNILITYLINDHLTFSF